MLDLVFTNNQPTVKTSISIPGISDHSMTVTGIDIIPQYVKQRQRKVYIFSKTNWDTVQEDMRKLSESIIGHVNSSSIEELWNAFKDGIQQSMDKNIPSKVCSKWTSLPWFNRNLKKMGQRKARLYRRAKKSNQRISFKTYQKHCKKAFKKAEINHINDVIRKGLDENNSKPFWRYFKSRRQDSVRVTTLKKMGQLINASKEKAQIMVEQFQSLFTRDSDNNLPDTRKRARLP